MSLFYQVGDGELEVELIDNSGDGYGHASSSSSEIKVRAEEALEPVAVFAEEALKRLSEAAKPDEVSLELGIEAGGKGGLFGLAQVHSKATILLKAKWTTGGETSEAS